MRGLIFETSICYWQDQPVNSLDHERSRHTPYSVNRFTLPTSGKAKRTRSCEKYKNESIAKHASFLPRLRAILSACERENDAASAGRRANRLPKRERVAHVAFPTMFSRKKWRTTFATASLAHKSWRETTTVVCQARIDMAFEI